MTTFRTVYDWVTLRDYEAAKERATDEVVERLSRGNTLAQDGSAMEEAELLRISLAADVAMNKLERHVGD
jgi:hypothetical protein